MAFNKVGTIFKIANTKTVDPKQWADFKKEAGIETAVIEEKRADTNKDAGFEVVAEVDPEKFIYIHTTIMAGVKTEANGFNITAETEKFINDNYDSWTCDDLLKDYPSFRRATTFVEHDQNLERAKGKCIDAIARQMPDTVLIDVLFSVDKKHKDLVANIESGIINAVSMGCTTSLTKCSICGNKASDSKDYCEHVRNGKGQMYPVNGVMKRAAEICLDNTFFDCSLVANPAFAGAVFRKVLTASQVSNHLLANILCNKVDSYSKGEYLLKAASKADGISIEVKQDGTVSGEGVNTATLSKDDVKGLKDAIASIMKEEAASTSMIKRLADKFFGKKEATHPIENISTNIKDFSIDRADYTGIDEEYHTPYTSVKPEAEAILVEDKKVREKGKKRKAMLDMFNCHGCGFEAELWDIRAANIDLNNKDVIVCPKCRFITESSIAKVVNNKKANVIKYSIKDYIVKRDIPVIRDEGALWFDPNGNSLVVAGEKVSFISSVDKNSYGMFKTEAGESLYIPQDKVEEKKSFLIQRPNEYHRQFESKPNTWNRQKGPVNDPEFKDNRDESGRAGQETDIFKNKRPNESSTHK